MAVSQASTHFLVDKHPLDSGPEEHREEREDLPASGDPPGQEGSQTSNQLQWFSAVEEIAV